MELKEYQKEVIRQVDNYLLALDEWRKKAELVKETVPGLDFPREAWGQVSKSPYNSKINGLGDHLPAFCLKVPTGGGKTLLATYALDLIQSRYMKKNTGIVLWIVPTNQIYRQTLAALRNRAHPYRQVLDLSSAGSTLVLEKWDRFTLQDVKEQLVVMALMLPSANRQNKETLKMFQDAAGFEAFFPPEGRPGEHEKLLEQVPNLDYLGGDDTFWGRQIKSSLGNVLRLQKPVVVIDEGQKAYSENAQSTICGFNPSIILELSATPPKGANILVNVKGRELDKEEMIKLDLHITNRASTDWRETMLASVRHQEFLEQKAIEYRTLTGQFIRPICLTQVERTGREQRGTGFIHAEDVREYLIRDCNLDPSWIAVKSSEKDDIEGINLYSEGCPIRYIITKQALQEGWDCSFAYILAILANPTSQASLTQLVGRILRQPQAQKTAIKELDESYVFCFHRNTSKLLEQIRKSLEGEGLGDLAGHIALDGNDPEDNQIQVLFREKFKKFEGKIFLPRFVLQEPGAWRELNYKMDILSRIDWTNISLEFFETLSLSELTDEESHFVIGYRGDELLESEGGVVKTTGLGIDGAFMTRQVLDICPNPWLASEICQKVITVLSRRFEPQVIANNLVFIINELKKFLEKERDRLAEQVFRGMLEAGQLQFLLEKGTAYCLPTRINVKRSNVRLTRDTGEPIQMSIFDYVPQDDFNDTEKTVAVYLDKQEKLLWWYRNAARADYYVQGWRKNRIYPDFVTAKADEAVENDFSTVYVIETKGLFLKNEDTAYKQSIFELCNALGEKTSWNQLQEVFPDKKIEFQVIFEDEWQREINRPGARFSGRGAGRPR